MKKNILSILLFMVVWGLLSSLPAKAQIETKLVKAYKITSKTYFTTPWLKKVFPCVDFYKAKLNGGVGRSDEISFDIDGEDYSAITSINFLIKQCESIKYASIEEIIETMIRLRFYNRDTTEYKIAVTKEFNKNPLEVSDTTLYNYKAVFKNYIFPEEIKLYFLFDGKKFIKSCGFGSNDFIFFSSGSEKKTDEVYVMILHLEGDQAFKERNKVHCYGRVGGRELEFHTYNIPPEYNGQNVEMKIKYKSTGIEIYSQEKVVTNGYAKFTWTPINPALTGNCEVQILHKTAPNVYDWSVIAKFKDGTTYWDMLFVPENIIDDNTCWFSGTGNSYKLKISYCNEFFQNHNPAITPLTIANYVKNAMLDIWSKEIIEWKLGETTTNPSGWPLDADKIYEVYINNSGIENSLLSYHSTKETACISNTEPSFGPDEQIIGIGSLRWQQNTPSYPDEQNFIRSVLSHEFFHGVHLSLLQKKITKNSFIYEGVPRFIQTIFMEPYNNYEFNNALQYMFDTRDFILNRLNLNLTFTSPPYGLRYDYCMFWRFLYENYKSGTPVQKLQVIREICKSSETVISVADVVAMLTSKLGAGSGTFANFTLAYQDFVKRVLFNNCNYNNWNPCPSNSFYYDVPATEQTYSGSPITVSNPTLESFGVKYYHYSFATAGRVYLQFDCDPNNNGNHADYYVNVLVDKSSGLPANNPLTITANNGEGGIFVDVTNPNDKIWVIVLRTDTKTGQTENYTLSMGASNNATYDFNADKTVVTGGKGMVTFTTTGNPIGYHWSFPGGSPSTSTSASPSVSYTTPGTYDVTLNDLTKTNYILVTSANQNPNLIISAGSFPSYPYTKYDFYCSIIDGNPPYNYHFDFGDGCTNSITNSYDDYVNISHTYPASGIYYPSVTVYDNNYEYQTENLEAIAVYDPFSFIHADFNFIRVDGGNGLGPRQFTSTTTGGATPYKQYDWIFGEDPVTHLSPDCGGNNYPSYINWFNDPNFNGNPTFDPNYTNYGTFPVTLTVTDYNGFSNTITKIVEINRPDICKVVGIVVGRDKLPIRIGLSTHEYFSAYVKFDYMCCRSNSYYWEPNNQIPPQDGCRLRSVQWTLFKNGVQMGETVSKLQPYEYFDLLDYDKIFDETGTYVLRMIASDPNQICPSDKTCRNEVSIGFEVINCENITAICAEPQLPDKIDVGGDIYIGLSNSCNNYTLLNNLNYFYTATNSIYLGKGYFSPGAGKKFFAQLKDCSIYSNLSDQSDETTNNNININYSTLKETVVENKTESIDISTLKMEVIPNPSEGKFVVSINGITNTNFFNVYQVDLKIYSMIGSLVYTNKLIKEAKTKVDLLQQLSGIYMVKLMINDKMLTQKIVLQ